MKNQITVRLAIYDYVGPFSELTARLGMNPDATYDIPKGITSRRRRWEVSSGMPKDTELETQISALLEKVLPYKDSFKAVSKEYEMVLAIGANFYEFNPEVVLSNEQISGLSEIGADLWLDIYCMYERDENEPEEEWITLDQ